jgi:serine/threonine protein kinase
VTFVHAHSFTDNTHLALKIVDFGFGALLSPNVEARRMRDVRGMRVTCRAQQIDIAVGTLKYFAPEMVNRVPYNSPIGAKHVSLVLMCCADSVIVHRYVGMRVRGRVCVCHRAFTIACSIMLYRMLCGRFPFNATQRTVLLAQIGAADFDRTSEFFTRLDDDARELVLRLLEVDPDKRLTASAALHHPFVSTVLASEVDDDQDGIARAMSTGTESNVKHSGALCWVTRCMRLMCVCSRVGRRDLTRSKFDDCATISSHSSGVFDSDEEACARACHVAGA